MKFRILLENIWKTKIEWDEPLTEDLKKDFLKCIQGISSLNKIKICRQIPSDEQGKVELIGFADPSNHAQAAVIYSRVKDYVGYKVTLLEKIT